jgi:hypothetical protein
MNGLWFWTNAMRYAPTMIIAFTHEQHVACHRCLLFDLSDHIISCFFSSEWTPLFRTVFHDIFK